jgi:integrase
VKLTVKSTDGLKLPAGKSDFIAWDDDIAGFGLRIRAGGSRTWIYQYRIGTKQRRMQLGSATAVPLSLARENAGTLAAKVALGGDPAMAKEAARREAGDTIGLLIDQYLTAKKPGLRPRSYTETERYLRVYAKPLHRVPIAALSRRDVAGLLNDIAEKAGPVSSNRLRASLSAFLSWAIKEGFELPQGNVVSGTNMREEKSRERVLKPHELRAIWDACIKDDYGAIVKMLMLTGQRLNEIAKLYWAEVHADEIDLPGERVKNHRAHTIPLSEPAKALLASVKRGNRTHVFGRDDTSGFSGWNPAKLALNERTGAIPHWTLHDLRRTVATGMGELGIQPHIIEAVLNHISGHKSGIAGIYNRATYDKEKREALNLWAEHLLAIVENRAPVVVPMKRA